ncbi:hypothetical protein VTO73DRAFT_7333 [Trametes versicolor]
MPQVPQKSMPDLSWQAAFRPVDTDQCHGSSTLSLPRIHSPQAISVPKHWYRNFTPKTSTLKRPNWKSPPNERRAPRMTRGFHARRMQVKLTQSCAAIAKYRDAQSYRAGHLIRQWKAGRFDDFIFPLRELVGLRKRKSPTATEKALYVQKMRNQ